MKFKSTGLSYKRKLVTFGILLFSGISLVSTGFSAWVVSQGSNNENNGNVQIGVVTEKSVDIVDLYFIAESSRVRTEDGTGLTDPIPFSYEDLQSKVHEISFNFDAKFGDTVGTIKYDSEKTTKFEALSMTVRGNVNNAPSLDTLVYNLELPQGLKTCVEKGYITIPEGSFYRGDDPTTIISKEIQTEPHETDSNKVKFKFDITFGWGKAFLGSNPSLYFDNQVGPLVEPTELTIPQDVTFDEKVTVLNELRGLMLGLTPKGTKDFEGRIYNIYDKKELEEVEAEKFKLNITAIAK